MKTIHTKAPYRAMQVTSQGVLELVERETPTPGTGEVLIEVEACGICGADISDIERSHPPLEPPRVVLGIGGLGHMALQFARKVGLKVVAVGRGQDIAEDAPRLGAYQYIDATKDAAADRIKAMGGAKAIISTIGDPGTISMLMEDLSSRGAFVLLGMGKDPLPVFTSQLVGDELTLSGSLTGTPFENEKTLDFSVLTGVRPQIETMPLERASEAYQKMKSGDVKFRMVLTMK